MIEVVELKGFGTATRYDAAHVIDDDGRILMRVLEPEARYYDDNDDFDEEKFRDAVRRAVRIDVEPPYWVQWDPGRDNVSEEWVSR